MQRRLVIFGLFTTAYFLSYFYRSANAVIAGDLAHELQLDAGQLGLMTSLFFASFAAVQLPLGIWLDRLGPRWVTPGLMWVGVAGSVIFGLAHSFAWIAVGRALIGVGMAGVLMGSLKIFSQWFPVERYGMVSGLLIGIGSLGSLAAASPMAWLNAMMGWRFIFGLGAVLTALVAGAIMLWARNAPPGTTLPAPVAGSAAASSIFRDMRFWRMVPLAFFLGGALMGFQGLWAGPYLFHLLNLDPIQAGNILVWMAVGLALGFIVNGWLADRIGMGEITAIMAAVFIVCLFGLAARPGFVWVTVLYAVFGFTGAVNVMVATQARRIFPLHMTGRAVSSVNFFVIGGTFLLQWWMGLIIGAFPADAAGRYPPQAYTTVLVVLGVGTVIALLWYLPLLRRSPGPALEKTA